MLGYLLQKQDQHLHYMHGTKKENKMSGFNIFAFIAMISPVILIIILIRLLIKRISNNSRLK